MSTPEQNLTADTVRGYSKEFLSTPCECGCVRVAHRNRSGACGCGCERFVPGQAARAVAKARVYSFGTIGPAALAPAETQQEIEITVESRDDQPTVAQFMAQAGLEVPSSTVNSPAPVLRPGSATRCPFCLADDFESVPSLKCPSCKAWQHHACVQEHKKCAACQAPWPE